MFHSAVIRWATSRSRVVWKARNMAMKHCERIRREKEIIEQMKQRHAAMRERREEKKIVPKKKKRTTKKRSKRKFYINKEMDTV
jgi:hypothetical protein